MRPPMPQPPPNMPQPAPPRLSWVKTKRAKSVKSGSML
jgi:hypothetical protein